MRYTATSSMNDSLTNDERQSIEQVMSRMDALMPAQRAAFITKIRTTEVVKLGAITLSQNAIDVLVQKIEQM